jgi:putative ABC transport system substrate-binding protein
MRRRDFISLLGGAAAACPLTANAQSPAPPLVGMLLVVPPETGKAFTEPIRAFLRALGYVEGRTIAFDFRFADGRVERLPSLAADLVARRPTVIITFGDATAHAAQAATTTIPIVSMSEDLVRARLVLNLARPEGNTTGVSIMGTELDAKRLELLAELLPTFPSSS